MTLVTPRAARAACAAALLLLCIAAAVAPGAEAARKRRVPKKLLKLQNHTEIEQVIRDSAANSIEARLRPLLEAALASAASTEMGASPVAGGAGQASENTSKSCRIVICVVYSGIQCHSYTGVHRLCRLSCRCAALVRAHRHAALPGRCVQAPWAALNL
jgi:hypothetical protein